MQVRFWGVRGSVPWATPSGIGHGCNTPCIQVTDERTGSLLILDAGSGIVGFGEGVSPGPVPVLTKPKISERSDESGGRRVSPQV